MEVRAKGRVVLVLLNLLLGVALVMPVSLKLAGALTVTACVAGRTQVVLLNL